jgi:signal peptidase I
MKRLYVICCLITALILIGCFERAHVSSAMAPTIKPNEKVIIDNTAYVATMPKRWDVVAFRPVTDENIVWLLRVVGLPGETISITSTGLVVNGKILLMPAHLRSVTYLPRSIKQPNAISVQYPYSVPTNAYFLLGDNSSIANDSRYMGPVSRTQIIGKVKGK